MDKYRYIDWIEGIPSDKYRIYPDGHITYVTNNKWIDLKTSLNKSGTVSVKLSNPNTKFVVKVSVAKLVLQAFKTMKFTAYDIIYKDGDSSNCNVENLEWDGKSDEYDGEEWKYIDWIPDIPGNKYQVSNYGRVVNMTNMLLLQPTKNGNTLSVSLNDLKNNVSKLVPLLRLVGTAFVDIKGYEKELLDIIRVNEAKEPEKLNHADNLRWVAPQTSDPLPDFVPDQGVPEEWKYIDWIDSVDPTMYKVSNYGRVVNVENNRLVTVRCDTSDGKPSLEVALWKDKKNKKVFHASLPRLVAIAFLPKPIFDLRYLVAQYKDGNIYNLRYDNIRWVLSGTQSHDNGLTPNEAVELINFINEHIYDFDNMVQFQEFLNEHCQGLGKHRSVRYLRECGVYGQPEKLDDFRSKSIRKQRSDDDLKEIFEYLERNHGSIVQTVRDLDGRFTYSQIQHAKLKYEKDIGPLSRFGRKRVELINIKDGSSKIFESASIASEFLGLSIATISKSIRTGQTLKKKKYIARYVDNIDMINNDCSILVYDINGKLIKEFVSVDEASRELKLERDHILKYCDHNRADKKGFIFKRKYDK
jgi:hypothetical protein